MHTSVFPPGAVKRWRKQMRRKPYITLNAPQLMEGKVGISCSCCLKGSPAKMGMIPLLTWLDSFCFWDEHIFNVKLKLYFYPHRDPYVIALRSVTVATVPPEESSIRSEAICAGFLVHELGYSTCKVPTTVWHLKLKNNKTLSCWIWTFLAALLGVLLQPGDLWSAALCGGKLSGLVQIYGRDAMSCISFLERDVLTTVFWCATLWF